MRICVFGAGAIGGHVATRLLAAGTKEVSVVARGAALKGMRERGLTLLYNGNEKIHAPVPVATDDPSTLPAQDSSSSRSRPARWMDRGLPAHAMATVERDGVHLAYEVVGDRGPWVALMPGRRRAMEGVRGLARHIAAAGHRVLIHDRRNCGASDVMIEGAASESEIWADDLHQDVDIVPPEACAVRETDMAARFVDFMARHAPHA